MKVFIFGCGYSGRAIGERLARKNVRVAGTTRSGDRFESLRRAGIEPVLFNGRELGPDLISSLSDVTHLVVSIAPPRQEIQNDVSQIVDPVLSAFDCQALSKVIPDLRWIGYLSTVGVYGNHNGAWVDESVKPNPKSSRSRQRVCAECEWIRTAESLDLPCGVFRLSGIYGPGRNALRSAHEGRSRRLVKKSQVFNRIHVDDIAQAIDHAVFKKASGIFNITDDEPAPPQDVVAFAHKLLGTTAPDEIDFETAELTPMARSFYGENKRVCNQRSKSELGMEYEWASFRVALQRMFDEDNW